MERNSREQWRKHALEMVCDVATAFGAMPFTTDHIRSWAKESGLEEPHDGRAWGAVMLRAIKHGHVTKTGDYTQSTIPSSHARPIPIYVSGSRSTR